MGLQRPLNSGTGHPELLPVMPYEAQRTTPTLYTHTLVTILYEPLANAAFHFSTLICLSHCRTLYWILIFVQHGTPYVYSTVTRNPFWIKPATSPI